MAQHSLINSSRRFDRLSYTPLVLPPADAAEPGDALGLAAMIRSLEVTPDELGALEQQASTPDQHGVVAAVRALAEAPTGSQALAASSLLVDVGLATLQSLAHALGELRSRAADEAGNALKELDRQMAAPTAPAGAETVRSDSGRSDPGRSNSSSADQLRLSAIKVREAPAVDQALLGETAATGSGPAIASHLAAASSPAPVVRLAMTSATTTFPVAEGVPTVVAAHLGADLGSRINQVMTWGLANAAERTISLIGLLRQNLPSTLSVTSASTALAQLLRRRFLVKIFLDALTRRTLQPLGLLHLERLDMTPLDVERGELVYSLPLSPREKVTLAHREWAVHEEQFSELISDHLENFSETGVAQSNDIAESTAIQTGHSNTLNMGQPVSANSTGVTLTSPVTAVAGTSVIADTATRQEARDQTRTVTSRASARTIQDHKTSFTVTTVSGMEDFTAHLLENPHPDKVMLVDYFARVRNWRSELYRCGVRLAYDVVLPDPGARLRARWTELLGIDDVLRNEFDFTIGPSSIGRGNWRQLADTYGAGLPAPPEPTRVVETVHMIDTETPYVTLTTDDGIKWTTPQRVIALSVTVPDGYRLDQLNVFANVRAWAGSTLMWITAIAGGSWTSVDADADGYMHLDWNRGPADVPATGTIDVVFRIQTALNGELKLTLVAEPGDAAMDAWRGQCFGLLRDAALVQDAQHRAYLRDRAGTLRRQIAADNTLHLRRLEREQVMRLVLSWLFPGFDDAASVLGSIDDPGGLDASTWQHVMEYGEYIKFVQNAIDWDHVTVFLYPYFWDSVWNERSKLFLEHPDAVHREFLRAGAARVIIAIQPGYEKDVVPLLDQGQLGKLTPQSRFSTVIADVVAANEEFVASIGADGEAGGEPATLGGTLIGTWTDYTPTSGIDMDVTLSPVMGG